MAFSTLSSTLIEVGKAIKAEIFTTLKNNDDDHETRISDLEQGSGKVVVFSGPLFLVAQASTITGVGLFVAPQDFTLTSATIAIEEIGSATGTIELDLKIGTSTNSATFSSAFSVRPSINLGTASNYDEASGTFSTTAVSQGDYLKLDVTSAPTGLPFVQVTIYGEVS